METLVPKDGHKGDSSGTPVISRQAQPESGRRALDIYLQVARGWSSFLFQGLTWSSQEDEGQCCENQGARASFREEQAPGEQFNNCHTSFKNLIWFSHCMLSEYWPWLYSHFTSVFLHTFIGSLQQSCENQKSKCHCSHFIDKILMIQKGLA